MKVKPTHIYPNPESHDNAVAQSDDGFYLVMELVQGDNASSLDIGDIIFLTGNL